MNWFVAYLEIIFTSQILPSIESSKARYIYRRNIDIIHCRLPLLQFRGFSTFWTPGPHRQSRAARQRERDAAAGAGRGAGRSRREAGDGSCAETGGVRGAQDGERDARRSPIAPRMRKRRWSRNRTELAMVKKMRSHSQEQAGHHFRAFMVYVNGESMGTTAVFVSHFLIIYVK